MTEKIKDDNIELLNVKEPIMIVDDIDKKEFYTKPLIFNTFDLSKEKEEAYSEPVIEKMIQEQFVSLVEDNPDVDLIDLSNDEIIKDKVVKVNKKEKKENESRKKVIEKASKLDEKNKDNKGHTILWVVLDIILIIIKFVIWGLYFFFAYKHHNISNYFNIIIALQVVLTLVLIGFFINAIIVFSKNK